MIERWNAFWFRRDSTVPLALFRILFALALYREIGTTADRSVFAIEGGFHLPYVSFIGPMSAQVYEWIHRIEIVPVVLLGLGLWTRGAITSLLLLQGYVFFADQLNFRNHPYFFLLLLLVLLFSPCGEALSLSRVLRRARGKVIPDDGYLGPIRPLTAQRLIQVQVSLVYVYAALHKINPWYLGGNGLADFLSADLLGGFSGDLFRALLSESALDGLVAAVADPGVMRYPAWVTVAAELFIAFGLWFRRTRWLAIAVGFGLHGGIALFMHIVTFSLATISSYLLFLEPATVTGWLARAFGETEQYERLHGARVLASPGGPR
jgi:hypothetical protein